MGQGPWLDQHARTVPLARSTLCPEGFQAKTSSWEEDKEKKGLPSEVSGKETQTENCIRGILGAAASRARPGGGGSSWRLELAVGGAGQSVSEVAPGSSSAEMTLHCCPALRHRVQDFLPAHLMRAAPGKVF